MWDFWPSTQLSQFEFSFYQNDFFQFLYLQNLFAWNLYLFLELSLNWTENDENRWSECCIWAENSYAKLKKKFDISYRWKFALVKELQVKAIANDCYGQWIIISLSWYKCFKLFYVNCSSKLGGNSFRNQNLLSKQSKLVNKMSGICSWRILQKRLKHLS